MLYYVSKEWHVEYEKIPPKDDCMINVAARQNSVHRTAALGNLLFVTKIQNQRYLKSKTLVTLVRSSHCKSGRTHITETVMTRTVSSRKKLSAVVKTVG